MKCCNLDWLEVYVLENPDRYPMDAQYYRQQGWSVVERDYGTRSYAEMFTLLDQEGMPFIEVRRAPIGVLANGDKNYSYEAFGAKVRLVNRYCYHEQAAMLMRRFIYQSGLQFSRISKVDVCLDFAKFDSGDMPQKFLSRYINGRYTKVNQANISAHGKDTWAGRGWHSIAWGSKASPVFTRLYCKSIELDEVKDKPYIRQAWAAAGLVDNPVTCEKIGADGLAYRPMIWRLEFSISSSVKRWVTVEDQVTPGLKKRSLPNTLEVYADRAGILKMIASLCRHYFSFRYYEEGVSKYKAKEKVLFNFDGVTEFYKVEKVATDVERPTIIKRLEKLLREFMLSHFDKDANHTAEILLADLQKVELQQMAVNPWDKEEVELLRKLLKIRLENKDVTVAQAKKMAHDFLTFEDTFWTCPEHYIEAID